MTDQALPLRVAMAQINPSLGDLASNAHKIIKSAQEAAAKGTDVLLLPELSLSGYMPEDLLWRDDFYEAQQHFFEHIVQASKDWPELHIVLGHAQRQEDGLYNGASLIHHGAVREQYHKRTLASGSGIEEARYFSVGHERTGFEVKGLRLSLLIHQDLSNEQLRKELLEDQPDTVLVLAASPYQIHQREQRYKAISGLQAECKATIFYCNTVGGQDNVVFDGQSMLLDSDSQTSYLMPSFQEALSVYEFQEGRWHALDGTASESFDNQPCLEQQVWQALVLATQDYFQKNGFKKAVLGLSGGIDSAVVFAIAADAIGAHNITTVLMPSQYTADISVSAAQQMADHLGSQSYTVAIENLQQAFLKALAEPFQGKAVDTTEENLQARIRGTLLMALSNKLGGLVLPTGNKSELATGYCTLYGDMVGGFAMLKDVPKTLVYRLAKWRNQTAGTEMIPEIIITRPPSAELAPDQKDQDSLPPYEILDAIIEQFVEHNQAVPQIVAQGFEEDVVKRVAHLIRINEYKRQQGAVGPQITTRSFGPDRRYAVTNAFKY
ncbi:NAD+ synthase [Brackiella oedipodis]|uniref:NAD+ synthase n=1 Tax=Brackiella oedipodis TaxID=124225 RepID=UPI00056FA556|nr:NAD+ synthase [Brackiella oedipodis]